MEWWQAAVLGLVEGVTEYLPISSTGHLILASSLLGLDGPDVKSSVDAFNIVIQGGAILAVLGLYRHRVVQMFRGLMGRDNAGFALLVNLLIAFLPAAIFGFLLDDWLEARLFHAGPVVGALVVGGFFMLLIEWWRRGRFSLRPMADEAGVESVTPRQALFIGLLQCVAMWPGTSRSMMTICGGVLTGLSMTAAAEFSFLLGLPTLGSACLYKLAKNLAQAGETDAATGLVHRSLFEQLGTGAVIVGLLTATVSASIAVSWLVAFLSRRGFVLFGWYRIALGAVLLTLVYQGVVSLGG